MRLNFGFAKKISTMTHFMRSSAHSGSASGASLGWRGKMLREARLTDCDAHVENAGLCWDGGRVVPVGLSCATY